MTLKSLQEAAWLLLYGVALVALGCNGIDHQPLRVAFVAVSVVATVCIAKSRIRKRRKKSS